MNAKGNKRGRRSRRKVSTKCIRYGNMHYDKLSSVGKLSQAQVIPEAELLQVYIATNAKVLIKYCSQMHRTIFFGRDLKEDHYLVQKATASKIRRLLRH